MTPRPRILAFGSAAALVLAGTICGMLVDGLTGRILTGALVTVGLGAAILLLFLEVGLSEDRELARERERRQERPPGARSPRCRPGSLRPRRRR